MFGKTVLRYCASGPPCLSLQTIHILSTSRAPGSPLRSVNDHLQLVIMMTAVWLCRSHHLTSCEKRRLLHCSIATYSFLGAKAEITWQAKKRDAESIKQRTGAYCCGLSKGWVGRTGNHLFNLAGTGVSTFAVLKSNEI